MSAGFEHLQSLVSDQRRAQRGRLMAAAVAGTGVAVGSVLLLGLSGWFITGAALAGLAGAGAAHAFNVLLPSAAIRLLAILRTGGRYAERVSGHEAALKALAALRPILFEDFAGLAPERALALSSGEASARLVQDVDAIQTVFVRLSGPWSAAAGSAAAIGIAALAGPAAAGVVAAGLIASIAGASILARGLVEPHGRETQKAVGRLKDRLMALQESTPELRAYGLETWAVAEVERVAGALDHVTARTSLGAGWVSAWQTGVTAVSVTGVVLASIGHPAPLVALAALAAVASAEAAGALTVHLRDAGAARQAMLRLAEGLVAPTRHQRHGPSVGVEDELAFTALGLSLTPPHRLAVSGMTGSGKTTLVERLMGLRPTPDQSLMVAGSSPRDEDSSLVRSRIAYAAQDVRLLEGSVRDNLLLADPEADDATLWRALDDAAIADRIRRSGQGLDLALVDNGTGLSGGERRRLGLARAYLRKAPWLVLDEPTEGLDRAGEACVLKGLQERLSRTGQGLILISHRPEPLAICDTEIVVEGLTQSGNLVLVAGTRRKTAA